MDNLQQQLGAMLADPQMMEKIQSMAQNLGIPAAPAGGQNPESIPIAPTGFPDPAMLQKLGGLMSQSQVDPQQQALLQALSPYLNTQRLQKLERAMRAARMAGMASVFLKSGR